MGWDQHVLMPAAGAGGRAGAMATLQAIAHDRLTNPRLGEILEELSVDGSLDETRAASVRVLKRDHEKATKVPERVVREIAEEQGLAFQAWTEARAASDFSILEPHLARMVSLKKEEADALGWEHERYDALLDQYEPEMLTSEVEALFTDLVNKLRPLAEQILQKAGDRPEWLTDAYEIDKQTDFCHWLIQVLNFDTTRGRLDVSPHPFTIHIGPGDVRQTTRYDERNLMMSIQGTIHESGHALYEQGIPEEFLGLPVGETRSLGLHESQSRLWEIMVGTGRPFTEFLLPHLKDRFPSQLSGIDPDDYYRGVIHPRRSLIRVNSDAVTYNLHITFRFELELALFRDELEVKDLPEAWDAAMEKHVGIRPDDIANGVLQDMHWSIGALGYFPTYSLGTLWAAALYRKAEEELPELSDDLRKGETGPLLEWLREKVHRPANTRPAKEIAQAVLGESLSADPFIEYLKQKYSEVYGLDI
ncbi:MAG: carboxypeptidase Taq [Actinomycetota bacterium]|jgi:carboxypeptidase Taq|nr:carboxypeptidase Taq [Actinomycetota bacterium]